MLGSQVLTVLRLITTVLRKINQRYNHWLQLIPLTVNKVPPKKKGFDFLSFL